ncbi:unnamed protein product [Adineta steineri]|uniref:Phosphatidic acid phosphatase type 2/haloperoxidase domain-containing protein n=1 Tax=Adineta steineri TaxID=433720 RepID=A0A814VLE5_9BILA|nr:unnamed protein product [Adineta steineri]CAF1190562.1 unnamed protein product [Adineta steineri]
MFIADTTNQSDSPSLTIGEFHTGTGRARQTPASRQRHISNEHPVRVRGTPEYNPLYDAFQPDLILPPRQTQNNFRPITPPPPRFVQNFQDIENAYDKPRSFAFDNKPRPSTNTPRQHSKHGQQKVESSADSEVDLLMDKLGGDNAPVDDVESCNQRKKRRRRRILYNFMDFLAIIATCAVFGLIYLLVPPVQRGFFCDDTTIQYPFRPDTIPMWVLAIYGGVGPIIIFCIVELWVVRPFNCRGKSDKQSAGQRRIDYFKSVLHTISLFVLGIAVCFLITEVGKRTIGRLRPYYVTACNPVWGNLNCTKTVQTASGSVVIPQYILDHNCNSTFTPIELREAKLSFPSGHSSYSTFAFIFLFVYFEARIVCPNAKFLKPFLQCLCVATAFFTCLSRVTDYKHHATDVIGGALIGFCIAVFTAVRVGTYLWNLSIYCETEDETKKDRLPKEERITVPGVETKPSGELRSNDSPHEQQLSRSRQGNRSNYDNVSTVQPQQQQHRAVNNLVKTGGGQRPSPSRGYEEANV